MDKTILTIDDFFERKKELGMNGRIHLAMVICLAIAYKNLVSTPPANIHGWVLAAIIIGILGIIYNVRKLTMTLKRDGME